jgi:hypothetical protein
MILLYDTPHYEQPYAFTSMMSGVIVMAPVGVDMVARTPENANKQ